MLFSVTANADPVWQSKPVQCAELDEIYQVYVNSNNLKPLYIGVANVATQDARTIAVPIIFYMNDVGQWLTLEIGDDRWTCVISLGDGFDPSISEEMINEILFGAKGT